MRLGRHRGWGSRGAWCHGIITLLALLTVIASDTHDTGDGDCCRLAPPGCRTHCYKVTPVQLAEGPGTHLTSLLRDACPAHLGDFWQCFNDTLVGVGEGVGWWGRPCCGVAVSPACQVACLRASDAPHLQPACRPSHEVDFYECVQRTQEGAGCCARTQSYRCRASCEAVFAARTPSRRLRHQLAKDCHAHAHVTRCAHSLTRTTPARHPEKNLHCCAASEDATCRATCRRVLTSGGPQQDILEELEAVCGPVDLVSGVWRCMFQHSDGSSPQVREASTLGRLGLDAAKLGCCGRATSAECRGLCERAFSREWGRAWDALQSSCLTLPQEGALSTCLSEADTPCQQGCSGLSFCNNFNNRPNELFRSCTPRADLAAQKDLAVWRDTLTLTLPGLAPAVPLLDIRRCLPDMWRAVACTLHLRPCHATSLTNNICWHDCVQLLSKCAQDPVNGEGVTTARAVCGALSPPPGRPCVSLEPFLEPSGVDNLPPWRVPTSPCRQYPCPPHHVCTVNADCAPGHPCRPYVCQPACLMGEVSSVAVPVGAFISVPFSPGSSRCGRVCQCGRDGRLEGCRYLACVDPAPCWLGSTRLEHDTEVRVGCQVCVCHAGELLCVPRPRCHPALAHPQPQHIGLGPGLVSRSLQAEGSMGQHRGSSTLPCGCPPAWLPVCASNGRTFPNQCLARCVGVEDSDMTAGDCGLQDVCGRDGKCGRGEVCVPVPATCLTPPTTPCPQHICVPMTGECPPEAAKPSCDSQGRQFDSLCLLVRAGATLSHLGNCTTRCSRAGSVCGRDGRTWASECQAAAHHVPIDYPGPCREVGVGSSCPRVHCNNTSAHDARCVGVEGPGWCCGRVCGGGVVLAWSTRKVEVAALALGSTRPLTVSALLASVAAEVEVSECEVRGHITLEGHVLVLVSPRAVVGAPVPPLVSRACVVEAERLSGVVSARSPRLLSVFPAAALTLAAPAHTAALAPLPCPLSVLVVAAVGVVHLLL